MQWNSSVPQCGVYRNNGKTAHVAVASNGTLQLFYQKVVLDKYITLLSYCCSLKLLVKT